MKLEIFITDETAAQLVELRKVYGNVSLENLAGFLVEDTAKTLTEQHNPKPTGSED